MSQKDMLRDLRALVAAYEGEQAPCRYKVDDYIVYADCAVCKVVDIRYNPAIGMLGYKAQIIQVTDEKRLTEKVSFIGKYIHLWENSTDFRPATRAEIDAAIRDHHKADIVFIEDVSTVSQEMLDTLYGGYMLDYADNPIYVSPEERSKFYSLLEKVGAPQPKHKKGERFEGKVFSGDVKNVPPNTHFVYTGILKKPRGQQWIVSSNGEAYHTAELPSFKYEFPCEILALVPDEPEQKYKVGQYVYMNDRGGSICKVLKAEDGRVELDRYNTWISTDHIRPAVPSDFERTVGNMRVRAYETGDKDRLCIKICWSDKTMHYVTPAVAAALGYPIIPLSVSGGKFEVPK